MRFRAPNKPWWYVTLGWALALTWAAPANAQSERAGRVVHRFDFSEPGYFGDVPRGWVRFPGPDHHDPDFPRYTEGRFDRGTGHASPPSFYLASNGRGVAYRYDGLGTRIRPGDYLVTGHIKPDRLANARACLSAYYLTWEGEFIPGTQQFSNLVGGSADEGWTPVRIHLPAAPDNAHYVGLTCWVVQEEVWNAGRTPHRHIPERDVHGGAWFDDVVVQGLPHAALTSGHAGNVVYFPERIRLNADIRDTDIEGLNGEAVVTDLAGETVYRGAVAARHYDDAPASAILLDGLPPGLYRAALTVFAHGGPVLTRTLDLAVLAAPERASGKVARRLGVVMDHVSPAHLDAELALLSQLGAGAVKLPIWTGDPERPGFSEFPTALHAVLDRMISARISVIGVLSGPPNEMVRTVGPYARSLLDILSADADAWRGRLDAVVAPYATIFDSWQLGGDGDLRIIDDPRAARVMQNLHDVMSALIPHPSLTAIASATRWPTGEDVAARGLTVALPADVRPAFVADHLAPFTRLDKDLTVSVPLPRLGAYRTRAALADWILRIVEARWAGADVVYVPRPWRNRVSPNGPVTEPTAPYAVFHTLVDTLGDGVPLARLHVAGDAEARAFIDGAATVIVMWDPTAPPEGVERKLQLGAATEVCDMWGARTPLVRTADGQHLLHLGPAPVFVRGAEDWLIKFLAELKIAPQRVDFSIEPQRHTLTVTNPRNTALSGEMTLSAPDRWEIAPRRLRFALEPGESAQFDLDVRQPQNVTAGTQTLNVHVELLSAPKYTLDAPLTFDLGLADVDVWGYAVIEGDHLLVRHGVTNRSGATLSFRGFATYPGRSRQYRVINELLPNQTLTTEYRFSNVEAPSGRRIRLGLREVNGPRIHNLEVIVP